MSESDLGLVPASSLIEGELEDDGDFEPGGRYKGFRMVSAPLVPPPPSSHQSLPARFYVESPEGAVGLVPWPGSQIAWPWEAGWTQDLHRTEVQSLVRPERKAKGKR